MAEYLEKKTLSSIGYRFSDDDLSDLQVSYLTEIDGQFQKIKDQREKQAMQKAKAKRKR